MKFNSPTSTRIGNVPDPQRARAQMTGVGHTRQASESTGMRRAQRVIDCAPAAQRAMASYAGYPAPTPVECAYPALGTVARQTTLRRG